MNHSSFGPGLPPDAVVGQWYRHIDKGGMFRVVGVDAAEDLVETQSFDGDIEEFAGAEWRTLSIETGEPPEDWTGPYDDIERDDLGYTDTEATASDWRAPVEATLAPSEAWEDAASDDDNPG